MKKPPCRLAVCTLVCGVTLLGFVDAGRAQLLGGLLGGTSTCTSSSDDCAIGTFSAPFAEPTIEGIPTTEKCITTASGSKVCKPAAGTIALLRDGRVLYFDALEGTENVNLSIVTDFGVVSVNDQTRVLALGANDAPTWTHPSPVDGGANPSGYEATPLLPDGILKTSGSSTATGALFCAAVAQLADGRILAAGGSDYYNEPGISGFPLGVLEIEGLRNARIFSPHHDTWTQTGSMLFGRWYPTLVTMADGNVLVASGVTKLLKPVYPDNPFQSGRNVVQTETYDVGCGTWSDNGGLAQRSLPTFPRMHLLPNGDVYYNAAGQAFDPVGQAYDQALWNIVGAYDPAAKQWTDLALAGYPLLLNQVGLSQLTTALNPTNPNLAASLLGTVTGLLGTVASSPQDLANQLGALLGYAVDPQVVDKVVGGGFRGSTSSVMLPLKPDASGNYTKAEFLTAGGVLSGYAAPSPGTYLATDLSRIDTVNTSGGTMTYATRLTGKLNRPRWYGSGVVLPDTSVMVFSGADRDGVVLPGLDVPVTVTERFDPGTETWKTMATQHRTRTYHNTALLLPDGRVLVGGHAPISTAYLSNIDLSSLGFSQGDGRDPSFEIYSPPYVFRNDRPVIKNVPAAPVGVTRGQLLAVNTDQPQQIESAILIRRTAITHLVDGDQRAVMLPIVARGSNYLQVKIPAAAAVVPAGMYMLFINKTTTTGPVPSTSTPVRVLGPTPVCAAG
jgi:hypothetical protein